MNKFIPSLLATLSLIGIGLSQAASAADNPIPTTAAATFDWSHLALSVSGVGGAVPTVVFSNHKTTLDRTGLVCTGQENRDNRHHGNRFSRRARAER